MFFLPVLYIDDKIKNKLVSAFQHHKGLLGKAKKHFIFDFLFKKIKCRIKCLVKNSKIIMS
jgi:hypothetical protein